jgi:hypothetical protein
MLNKYLDMQTFLLFLHEDVGIYFLQKIRGKPKTHLRVGTNK